MQCFWTDNFPGIVMLPISENPALRFSIKHLSKIVQADLSGQCAGMRSIVARLLSTPAMIQTKGYQGHGLRRRVFVGPAIAWMIIRASIHLRSLRRADVFPAL
jgi:hypothetical protein